MLVALATLGEPTTVKALPRNRLLMHALSVVLAIWQPEQSSAHEAGNLQRRHDHAKTGSADGLGNGSGASPQPATSATSTELIGQLLRQIPDPVSPRLSPARPVASASATHNRHGSPPQSSWMKLLRDSPERLSPDRDEVTSKLPSSTSPGKRPAEQPVEAPAQSEHIGQAQNQAAAASSSTRRARTTGKLRRYPKIPGDVVFVPKPKPPKRQYREYEDAPGVPPKLKKGGRRGPLKRPAGNGDGGRKEGQRKERSRGL